MIRYLAGWAWVLHANVVDAYPGSSQIDSLLFYLAYAR